MAFNELELKFKEYEVLCMKPSPASLKILCRSHIRNLTRKSNENIELINKNNSQLCLPNALINYLKYPTFITSDEYMFSDEKIVSRDGKFELVKILKVYLKFLMLF